MRTVKKLSTRFSKPTVMEIEALQMIEKMDALLGKLSAPRTSGTHFRTTFEVLASQGADLPDGSRYLCYLPASGSFRR
jgi:hypothetical protein